MLALEKHRVSDEPIRFPLPRRRSFARLASADGEEEFVLDIYFGDVDFSRFSIQLRARQSVILARLELDGPIHENPDGFLIPTPHLHLYREGEGVIWAFKIPTQKFTNLSDRSILWNDFMCFCNITIPPRIQRDMFS
ncbi:MAG: hypothetical protein OXG85_06435 [Chloroflexi bacterium]|nr:hypothetical protein [Chloroflexota bacterium]